MIRRRVGSLGQRLSWWLALETLVGLGYRELSMAPSSIRLVREVLASSRIGDVEKAVGCVVKSDSLTAESFAKALAAVQAAR